MSAKEETYELVSTSPVEDMKPNSGRISPGAGSNTQQDDTPIIEFVRNTFKKATCKRFEPKKGEFCHCGYLKENHSSAAKQQSQSTGRWKASDDTVTSPTDAFGEAEFVISGQKICKYIRVDCNTKVEDLMALMFQHWQMKTPNLLISVTGGAQNFKMNDRLKEVFRQGLVKAAESTQAWIVTGGTNTGVMKHVGEALRDYTIKHGSKKQLVALGIATWGCIENKEDLISESLDGSSPAVYRAIESEQKKKEAPLDPNHTHFILVDNGTQHSYGVEIELRAKLESKISMLKTTEGKVSIPIVCVVLEGGPNTLETVRNAIEAGTPAIVVEGSGRAADILAYAYKQCQTREVEYDPELKKRATIAIYDESLKKELAKRIRKEFGKKEDENVDKSVDAVLACIRKIDHMTTFSLGGKSSAKDIDIMILKALLKVNRENRIDQLRLALAWNRADIARDEIFTDGVRFEESDLNELMFSAIIKNRVEFVKLFLDKGIDLKKFLTRKRIDNIYNDPVTGEKCRQLRRKSKKHPEVSLKNVGMLIKVLNGELFEPIYCKFDTHKGMQVRESLTGALKSMNPYDAGSECPFDEPAADLFIWSILTQRQDMAMAFWYESRDDLALAVVGHLLLGSILRQDPDPELNQELQQQVTHYEQLGVGLLSEYLSSDPKKTTQLLIREHPTFGGTTVLKMAVQADNKDFIAHTACQNLLTEIWTGALTDDNHKFKVLLSIFCPFLAPLLLKYREKEIEPDGQSSNREQGSTGSSGTQLQIPKIASHTEHKNGKNSTKLGGEAQPPTSPCVSYFKKFKCFFQAPVAKFSYNCLAYLAFLLLFAVILLTDFYPKIGIKEQILIAWVGTLIFEEIRQVAMDDAGDVRLKLYNYINDVWNVLDVITIVMFLAGMILRFIPVSICGQCFYAARIVLAINFMTFFFRILHMFSIHRELGPKLVMIGKMMIDLFYFMVILLVFIAAYGIASQIILYPNQELNISLARDVLSHAWWSIFGEFGLDEISGKSDTCNDTNLAEAKSCASMEYFAFDTEQCSAAKEDQCPAIDWLVPIILGIYVLITNVLMLNLLIAMFTNTFEKVHGQTNVVWKMQRYHLVREYDSRPMLPPPLIIFGHIFLLCRYIIRRWCQNSCVPCEKGSTHFRLRLSKSEEKELLNWENVNAEEYLRKTELENAELQARDTSDRVNLILDKVEAISDTNSLLNTSDEGQHQLPPLLEKRFAMLEKQMKKMSAALDWITQNLAPSSKQPFKYASVDEDLPHVTEEKDDPLKAKIQKATEELKNRMKLHRNARDTAYAKPTGELLVNRTSVPDGFVSFDVHFPDYNPVQFIDESVTGKDVDLKQHPESFNPDDHQSWMEGSYRVAKGYPLNPEGRTGLKGRGVLKRWGPNYIVNVVITRWQRSTQEEKFLEFVAVQRQDQWFIPEEETEFDNQHAAVQRCFQSLLKNAESAESVLSQTRMEVCRGYLDDNRNTDNAWIEAMTLNYHVLDDKAENSVSIKTEDTIKWMTIRRDLSLDESHLRLLSRVAKQHKASF